MGGKGKMGTGSDRGVGVDLGKWVEMGDEDLCYFYWMG